MGEDIHCHKMNYLSMGEDIHNHKVNYLSSGKDIHSHKINHLSSGEGSHRHCCARFKYKTSWKVLQGPLQTSRGFDWNLCRSFF